MTPGGIHPLCPEAFGIAEMAAEAETESPLLSPGQFTKLSHFTALYHNWCEYEIYLLFEKQDCLLQIRTLTRVCNQRKSRFRQPANTLQIDKDLEQTPYPAEPH
jgi:hypothetical protein